MIAYKAFKPGLICREYQFKMGLNVTDKANCGANGFHCAENPLDCLRYYPFMDQSEYYVVDAGGDIDEDAIDSKISCTKLTLLKKLNRKEFFMLGLAYMADHPLRENSFCVSKHNKVANNGYAVVRNYDPVACGNTGDYLLLVKEDVKSDNILQVALIEVDCEKIKPGVWYDVNLNERRGGFYE